MQHETEYYCPECDEGIPHRHSRRDFLRAMGGATALAVAGTQAAPAVAADQAKNSTTKPAENLIRELYSTLSAEQKKELVFPWDHKRGNGKPERLATHNRAAYNLKIGQKYTKPQQELVQRTLRSILSSDESFERISRNNKWDQSGSFENCGAVLFGDPSEKSKFTWVFSGHHLTLRCDGNSEPGAAFGGPMYYGHIVNGYSPKNVFHYQTEKVHAVYNGLDAKQREKAIADKNPGDRERGIQFPKAGAPKPGISYGELTKDQQALVENVMRTLIAPFRKEDSDEVMQIIKANGGMEKIHLAFYEGRTKGQWQFWRLEGPGFIWNYRVLPHVHCYVNILTKA